MPQVIPIQDLKNTSEISKVCHKTSRPVFYYDLEISEKQIKMGKTQDAKESLKILKEKYGL